MTCDYDNDRFNQGLKLQHPHGNGHSHCQGSWSKLLNIFGVPYFFVRPISAVCEIWVCRMADMGVLKCNGRVWIL